MENPPWLMAGMGNSLSRGRIGISMADWCPLLCGLLGEGDLCLSVSCDSFSIESLSMVRKSGLLP